MNEQAILDSYNTFVSQGYTKSLEEFKKLIATNPQALEDSYNAFKNVGYTKSLDEYKNLMGVSAMPQPQAETEVATPVEKKSPSVTTASPSVASSSVSPSQKPEEDGFFSKIGKVFKTSQEVQLGIVAEAGKTILDWADDIVNASKEALRGQQFFGDKIPDTDKPISDAVKKTYKTREEYLKENPVQQMKFDPLGEFLEVTKIIINSTLPEDKKNSVIESLAIASNNIKKASKSVESYQKDLLPEGNIPVEVAKGIAGFTPELVAAALMKKPQAAESRLAKWAERTTKSASPLVKKVAPKAAKLIEESVVAPMTKIMAVKGALSGVAETKEGESPYTNAIKGSLKGTAEGMYMHGLGEAAGKVSPVIAKQISKTGINSAIATGLAMPLANAGVFTTARTLRTAAEEGRLITAEEAAMEAGTGIGFSLLHLGSVYDTHKEANHYYESVLKTDPAKSFFRVLNETKPNLDLAYNPELTPERVKELEEARDELKKAIVKEPDLKNKKILGDEAIKIQNQLDAHNAINGIVESRNELVWSIIDNDALDKDQKNFYIDKINAIADAYDQSDFGVSKRELNSKINEAQKKLDAAAEVFTNSKTPSDREIAKSKVDEAKAELNNLNNQLTELVKNKQKEDAVQKQKSDEALLRTGEEELGLQQVDEGDTQLEITPEQKQAISTEGTEEVVTAEPTPEVTTADPLSSVESTENALIEYTNQPDFGGTPSKKGYKDSEKQKKFFAVDNLVPKEIWEKGGYTPQRAISEAYHKAKADGSNPELVKAVEDLLGVKPEAKPAEPTDIETQKADIERRKRIGSGVIDHVWARLAKEGIDNADLLIGTRDTISNIDFDKFWASVKKEDLEKYKSELKDRKQADIDAYERAKGEFDPQTGTFTSDNTTFWDNKIKDVDAELAALEAKSAEPTPEVKTAEPTTETKTSETKYRREDFPDLQTNTRTPITQKILDYFSDVLGIPKFTEDLSKGTYVSWLQNANPIGYDVADMLNNPKKAFDVIAKYETELKSFRDKTAEPTPEAKTAEPTPEAKSLADKIRAAKVGKGKAFDAILGIPVAIWDGSVELVAKSIEAGKSISDAVKSGIKYIKDNYKGKFDENEYANRIKESLTPGYKDVMDKIQEYADFSTRNKEYWQKQVEQAKKSGNKQKEAEAKTELAKYTEGNLEKAIEILEESDTYKNASDIEKEELVRDVRSRFELKEKKAPSPEELFGDVADANKVMEELNFLFDDANKSKDYLDKEYRKAKEAFDKNPTSETLKRNLDKAKAEVEEYRTKNIEQAIAKLRESESYNKATPDQQARMEKYLTEKFLKSQTEKILPTKLFGGAKDIKKVTTTEKKAWKDQLSAFVRGIKNQAEATKAAMKEVSDVISSLVKKGSITTKQLNTIVKKMSDLKVFDAKSVDKFVDYVSKVFTDAEYNDKLIAANKLRSSISKLASAKGKDPNLVKMAKEFNKIKPSMVEDIDAYNQMAAKIKESLAGSKAVGKELKIAEMVKIADVAEYTKTQLEAQEKALYEQKLAEVNELLDADLTGATLQELIDLVKSDKPIDKEKETIIRDAVKRMFDINSSIIKKIIETGEDPFTGEKIELSEADKDLVKRFMDMNLDNMSVKQAIEAMDSLSNFLQNGSIAKMESIVRDYQGKVNAKRLVSEGLVAKDLMFYKIKSLGRLLGEQISTLPNLIEKMFKGFGKSSKFERMSGITEMKNKKTLVQTKVNAITNEYVDRFYKTKANGKDFTDTSNIVERGIIAALRRSVAGTPEEQQAEFNRKKGLIEQSIDALKSGSEKEKELGKIYEEAYNKNLKDSQNINEVIDKSADSNVEAVDFWIEKWSEVYDQLADVSESVYNKILDKDIDYTPDRFSRLFNRGEAMTEAQLDESLFHNNNGTVYKKKAGVLESAERPSELPKNSSTGEAKRYLDLSFDRNNSNAMYDALMDINTAGVVRQIESFFRSPEIKKVIPSEQDRAILYNDENTGRVQDFIRAARNKEIVASDEAAKLLRKLNVISSIGTATALGGVLQPIKQVAPVALNTLINTRGRLDLNYFGDKNDFMNRIGYGISVRGMESQAQISSINKLVDLASKSKGAKALGYIEKANRMWLEVFLKHPDIYIAKASWMAYYEKSLKKQGIDPKGIDYKTHDINQNPKFIEAADYAQKMVDRQQNISDTDLQGKWLGSKSPTQRFITSAVMPFASFRLNQFMRATSDLATLTSLTSSTADRKIAANSLAGYGAEMLMFKVLATGISVGLGSLTNYLMDKDESSDDYEKRIDNVVRGQVTGTVTDVLSPLPPLDYIYAKGADGVLYGAQEMMDIEDDEKFRLMTNYKTDILKSLGTFGIGAQKAKTVYDAFSLSSTGQFTDEYGRVKYISESDREALKLMGSLSLISNLGLAPSEVNTISRNAVNYAKKTSSTLTEGELEEKKTKKDIRTSEEMESLNDELDVLNQMLKKERKQDKINEIEDMISDVYDKMNYLNMSKEERKDAKLELDFEKELRKKERERVKSLLGGYESRADLKRYNPRLYEKNFGKKSHYYKERKAQIKVKKDKAKMERKLKDKKYKYRPKNK